VNLNSILQKIEIRHFQILREGQPLLVEPLFASFSSGMLNIVTGANGSGKTTLLDLLARRVNAIDGCSDSRCGHSRKTEIAYLPQTFANILDIKVSHLIDLAFRKHPTALPIPGTIANVLKRHNGELGELAGGQQQILLFWLVASQPLHVFIYDEPLRHLDPNATDYVTHTIEQQVQRGDLVVLSDHSDGSRWSIQSHRVTLIQQE
jgi:ABC-2 type transport system ATP-binding protein